MSRPTAHAKHRQSTTPPTTSAVYEQCRANLVSRRADLLQAVNERLRDPSASERGSETPELVDNLRMALKDLDDALSRLANGTFGTCELCKMPISHERLTEAPAARHCRECEDECASVISADRDVE